MTSHQALNGVGQADSPWREVRGWGVTVLDRGPDLELWDGARVLRLPPPSFLEWICGGSGELWGCVGGVMDGGWLVVG